MTEKSSAIYDFLLTYGWAILVVMAAIGALYYFGTLDNPETLSKECCQSVCKELNLFGENLSLECMRVDGIDTAVCANPSAVLQTDGMLISKRYLVAVMNITQKCG